MRFVMPEIVGMIGFGIGVGTSWFQWGKPLRELRRIVTEKTEEIRQVLDEVKDRPDP